jgi:cobalt-zinc-cadmium efflux system outer membrane protein
MRIGRSALALCTVACVHTAVANAQGRALTLSDVLARAREQAPQIVSARLALEETRGRLLGASVPFQNNPEIDIAVGNRRASDTRFTDMELGLGHTFEPRARRTARMAGANAAIAQSAADVDAVTRVALRDAAAAYYRAIHADLRIRLLTRAQELATGVYSAADRRFKAGDIAVLDVNIARASMARVRADREAAEAAKALALGDLKQLLRIEEDVSVAGELTTAADVHLPALLQTAAQRPELRALEAGVQEAEAEVRLGQAFARPEYGVGVRYAREEGDQIVRGGLTVTLPIFSKGQELRAVGAARAARLRADLDAARARVRLEVRSAFEAYSRRLAAVRVLETEAIPGLDENETLTARSFEVGQIGLPELLLIRREILETRSQYLTALMEAALARIDLDASAAILR